MAKKSRKGGGVRYFTIQCAVCREPVLLYQKDGPGGLLRMYLDRILAPPHLAALQDSCIVKADVPNLVCPKCDAVLAVPVVYNAAHGNPKRLALRVITGRLVKTKGTRHEWDGA
ncbi:MAG: hypothetical protein JXA10_17985 [Anaerolineae bacterium]|nr:hypothetical protein [Anaerolineae bacterium]